MPENPPPIEVWSAAASADRPGELERCCEAWLTDEERQRAMRFRKDTSRNQHIVGRGMTRMLLSAVPLGTQAVADPADPSRIELGFTPHGKPFVSAPTELSRPFNVAHTDGLVLFASCPQDRNRPTSGATIGVDVERMSRTTDVALAQRYFAPPEVEYVFDHHAPDRRLAAFLRVWTLKEAFIKAIGSGLTMPLGDFTFERIDDERPRVRMLNPRLGSAEHWQFVAFCPADGYVGALALSDWPADQPAEYRLRSFESLLGSTARSPGPSGGAASVTHGSVAHRTKLTDR